jgi:hypothetical protein
MAKASDKPSEEMFSKYDLGSGFLRSSDMVHNQSFRSFLLTIDKFHPAMSLEGADKKPIKHPCLGFKETTKLLVLNSTSQEVLHMVTGESDGFKTIGHKVRIEAREIEAFGERCYGLRLMPSPGTLMRRGVKKFLGKPAVFVCSSKSKEEGATDGNSQAGATESGTAEKKGDGN